MARAIVRRLLDWLRARADLPPADFVKRQWVAWEYNQVDRRSAWESESNVEGLSAAISLRKSDPASAFRAFLDLAEEGSIVAMDDVGECYLFGRGVAVDTARAEMWFSRAFRAGSWRAMLSYGDVLARRGDFDAAEAVFRKGVAAGWAPALYRLAKVRLDRSNSRRTLRAVRPLLERAAAQGHPGARHRLAREMSRGRLGVGSILGGWRLLMAEVKQELREWDLRQRTAPRRTATGETLH